MDREVPTAERETDRWVIGAVAILGTIARPKRPSAKQRCAGGWPAHVERVRHEAEEVAVLNDGKAIHAEDKEATLRDLCCQPICIATN